MPLGPVQLLVIGFDQPEFKGAIRAELDRLRESDVVRLIDAIVVRKDEEGQVEKLQVSDLSTDEAEEFGALVGALVGFGFGGDEESMEAGAVLGVAAGEDGHVIDEDIWYIDDAIPNDSAAAIALIEHRWAIPLRDSIREAGGFHLADAWVHPRDLVAIGLLAAEEAETH
jgi:uncharacterized membrane protein